MRVTLKIWRQPNRQDTGKFVSYPVDDVESGDVDAGVPRRAERTTDREGEEPDGVRTRLPRGHLRLLRIHDQWHCARANAATTVCQLTMRHFKDGEELDLEPWRAAAFPADQGPRGRSPGIRSHHRGGRLHLGLDRQCAGRQRDPGVEGSV